MEQQYFYDELYRINIFGIKSGILQTEFPTIIPS